MTSQHDDFWGLFDLDEMPVFTDPNDLSRFSVETHANKNPYSRTQRSSGHLRLTGNGVAGHRASLADVGHLAATFQKLVTALGSSIFGARQSISAKAQQLTELQLDASPMPGSLILNFVPVVDPEQELRGKGEMLDSEPDQLIDKTFAALGQLLQPSTSIDSTDQIVGLLKDYGSMTSVTLRNFASAAADGDFDLDVLWQQPRLPSLRMHVSAESSRGLARLVQGRRLDEEPVELVGVLSTVSSSDHWVVADQTFGKVAFGVGKLLGEPYSAFNPGVHVRVAATMTTVEAPGRAPTHSFEANSIQATASVRPAQK